MWLCAGRNPVCAHTINNFSGKYRIVLYFPGDPGHGVKLFLVGGEKYGKIRALEYKWECRF